MALFAYKAMTAKGKTLHGESEAINLADLEQRLKRMGLDLITAQSAKPSMLHRWRGIPQRERIHFCFHLEQLTRAGVPLIEALADLRDSSEHPRMHGTIAALVESIEGGHSLSQALTGHGQVFSPVFCSLVRAGEASGKLPEVLRELTASLKREDELSAYIKRLTIYPSIVLLATLGAVVVSMLYVVPELSKLFRSTGLELPLQTRLLIGTSSLFQDYWMLIFPGSAGTAMLLALLVSRNAQAAYRWDALKLALPLAGSVYRKIILARFSSLFAMMYVSGITIIDTLRTAQDVVGNHVLRQAIQRVEQDIAEGQNVTTAFANVGLFPPLVVRMLRIGEYTGALDQALNNVSYFYERDVRESIERLQVMLEPLLIVVLGGLILWVALSVLGPIYDVITRMKM